MNVYAETQSMDGLGTPFETAHNFELSPARTPIAAALLGLPRGTFGAEPAAPLDPHFNARMETADLGPFTVTGLEAAVGSLRGIVTDISLEAPEIYPRLGCREMLSCRLVRGAKTVVSAHSFGIALDLTVDGKGHTDGSDEVMAAVLEIAPLFNRHGFYWGLDFGLQDALHFEASDELMRQWAGSGRLGANCNAVLPRALNLGDRGPKVLALQAALNRILCPVEVPEDGLYGPETRMAVFAFQNRADLPPTGAAPKPVLAALGLS